MCNANKTRLIRISSDKLYVVINSKLYTIISLIKYKLLFIGDKIDFIPQNICLHPPVISAHLIIWYGTFGIKRGLKGLIEVADSNKRSSVRGDGSRLITRRVCLLFYQKQCFKSMEGLRADQVLQPPSLSALANVHTTWLVFYLI